MKKRLLSILLVLCMAVSLFTVTAFAAGPVAKIGDTTYATLQEAIDAVAVGETIQLLQSDEIVSLSNVTIDIASDAKLTVNDGTLTDVIIKGDGNTSFNGTVNFYGDNQVISAGLGGSPFNLIVNKGATLLITRFVLGYGRNITVYGEIEDAHAFDPTGKTPSLKFNSTSGVSVGGTGTGNLTVEDAYIELGSSSWKSALGTYDWNFTNAYVSATSFTNCNAPGSDSAHWDVTFDDSVLAAKNYIKNGVGTTYSFTNGSIAKTGSLRIDGVLNIDATSSVTTTAQQNNKVGALDEHGGINGTVNVSGSLTIGSNANTQLEVLGGTLNVTSGGEVDLGSNTLTLDAASTLASAGDITAPNGITLAAGADVTITGGKYHQDMSAYVPDSDGYEMETDGSGGFTIKEKESATFVAQIGDAKYTTLQNALKAIQDGETLTLLKDLTITGKWDCRPISKGGVGATFTAPVTIDGNGHTLKFTGEISDGYNHLAAFRFEDKAVVKNLTVDMSEAISVFQNRFSAISSKAGDLTVDNCKFIGSTVYTKARAIIFGEGASDATDHMIDDLKVSITNCEFINWGYGVTDNMNRDDAKSVSISCNNFENANVAVTAFDSVVFTGNELNNSNVSISSYTDSKELEIDATGNTFEDSTAYIDAALEADVVADDAFDIVLNDETGVPHYIVTFELPVGASVEVKDAKGNVCEPKADYYALANGDYTYTVSKFGYFDVNGCFTVAGGAQTVTVDDMIFIPNVLAVLTGATAPKAADSFVDVDDNAWYYDAVNYVLDNGLMNGMSEDTFAPNGTMTRAMVWTVLGRMAGQEFNGIGANWYSEAQNWAILNGISDGTNPNGAITREELVTMLWRFVGQPEGDVSVLQWYGDTGSVSDWAAEAMAWAVNGNIIQGTDWNLNPASVALRAQVAAILMRYCG